MSGELAINHRANPTGVIRQALDLGADVVVGTAPHGGLDVAIAESTDWDSGSKLTFPAASATVALGNRIARALVRQALAELPSVTTLPPDSTIFNPDMEGEGLRLREVLGIGVDEMLCLWIPPTHGQDGATKAARAFVALAGSSGRIRDKLRLVLPDFEPTQTRDALAVLASAGCQSRALTVRVSAPTLRYEGTAELPWNVLCAAANVGLALSDDAVGSTAYEALASGCPVVAPSTHAAAELLRPGASGEAISIKADAADTAAAAARLLATERAQRSRPFVSMASHVPTVASAVDWWESLLQSVFEHKLLSAMDLRPMCDPVHAHAATARRFHAEIPYTTTDSQRPNPVDYPAGPPPGRWVSQATAVSVSAAPGVRALLRAASLSIPGDAWVPGPDQIFQQDDDTLRAAWRIPGGGGRDRMFVPSRPGTLFSTVWFRDSSAGEREFALMKWLAACGLPCADALACGSDGRRSFLVTAEAPGLALSEFLRSCASPGVDAGRAVRLNVFRKLAHFVADLHSLGVTAGGLDANDVSAALEPTGGVRLTLASTPRASRIPGGVTSEVALRDVAWLAHSLGGTGLFKPIVSKKPTSNPEPSETTVKPIAAASGDVAKAIGMATYGAKSVAGSAKPELRGQDAMVDDAWSRHPEGVSRSALLRAFKAWVTRRARGEEVRELLQRLVSVQASVRRERDALLERQREARNAQARERIARGELVPVSAKEL